MPRHKKLKAFILPKSPNKMLRVCLVGWMLAYHSRMCPFANANWPLGSISNNETKAKASQQGLPVGCNLEMCLPRRHTVASRCPLLPKAPDAGTVQLWVCPVSRQREKEREGDRRLQRPWIDMGWSARGQELSQVVKSSRLAACRSLHRHTEDS